jgi:hypothetical protein
MNNKMTFNAEVQKELEELRDYLTNSEQIKTFADKTANYPSVRGKGIKYIGLFLCQGSTTYYMCKAGLINTYLMGDKSLLKANGSKDYENANYYKEMQCPNQKINDYDVYMLYEGIDNRALWRNARMAIPKEEGFNGKKMDITKKAIQKRIVDSNKSHEEAIREYIKHKAQGYHLSKRPIIMLDPEIKVIWHGQKGCTPNFIAAEQDYKLP